MYHIETDQKILNINGVRVGGRLGETPTLMIGSIFYKGESIVKDADKGLFDRRKAESLIQQAITFSDVTGLPLMIDVVGASPKAIIRYLDFVAGLCDFSILLDGVTEETLLKSLDYVNEAGLSRRIVFNLISQETQRSVLEKIKETKIESAVLLTYNVEASISTQKRVELAQKLISMADKIGIRNKLIDTAVLDLITLGMAVNAVFEVKRKLGYPTGCGAHNAIDQWKNFKKKVPKRVRDACAVCCCIFPVVIGADFILYGPIELSDLMFSSISLVNACYGQLLIEKGKKLQCDHPRFKVAKLPTIFDFKTTNET